MKTAKRLILFTVLVLIVTNGFVCQTKAFNYTDDVRKVVMDNGITLLLKENPAYDVIAISLMSSVGTVQDPEGLEGLTYLTQLNLISGTENRTGQELIMELESWGVQLQVAASYDYSAVLLQTMPSTFEQSFAILMDMITASVFPERELERERILSQRQLQALSDDPTNAIVLAYLDLFYGEHPYKYSPYGTDAGLSSVQRDDLIEWHKYVFQPEHLVIAVVGNFSTLELLPVLEENFGDWENSYAGNLQPRAPVPFAYPGEDREVEMNVPLDAAFLVLGYPAPDMFDEDSAAMTVINGILGGGMSSRLFTEIRDKKGLAYTAVSQYDSRLGPSNLLTFLATHPETLEEAKTQVLNEIQRFGSEGLSESEIAKIAVKERGSYLLQNETNLNQALTLGMAELTGRGYKWVDEYMSFFDEVKPADIKRVARKYFQHYTGVVITP
ncbi:MAG: insulinase family protein [Firmicutes bacterium]|nr:insulinase family protein [Bacillota bacterium]